MKKWMMVILALAAPALADIAVTPGSGKTVATITNSSREFQQVSSSIDGSSNTVVIAGTPTVTQNGTWTMQPGNTANTTAWFVQTSTASVGGSTIAVVNASGTKLLVTPDSVALPANQSMNESQINGATPLMNNGISGTGSQRVNIASDNTAFNVAVASLQVHTSGDGSQTVGWQIGGSSVPVGIVGVSSVAIYGTPTVTANAGTGLFSVTSTTTSFNGMQQPINLVSVASTSVVTDGTAGVQATGGHFANNGVAAATNRIPTLPGIAQVWPGNGGAAYTPGSNAAAMILSSSGLMGVWPGPDITWPSYSASTMSFTVITTTGDVAGICGNATNTVYLYGIRASCTQTTAGIVPISIAKRSSAYTGPFSTATAVAQDANYAVVRSTVQYFNSAGMVNGTLIGYLDSSRIGCMATGTATPNDIYISPSAWKTKPIVLRGIAQCVGINFQQQTVTGGTFTAAFDWMEVVSP